MTATIAPVIPLPVPAAPDPDIPVVAAYFARQGWTALDAFHVGLDAKICAAMWILEASSP